MSFWRKDFSEDEINHVLEQLKPLRKISDDGKVILDGAGNIDMYTAFLISAVGFDVRTDALKARVVKSALFSPNLKIDFKEKDFRDVVYKLRHKYQVEDVKPYKVVFPLWNIPPFLKGVRKGQDVTINFSPSIDTRLFKKITQERDDQRSDRQYEPFFSRALVSDLRACSSCVVHVVAHSPADAHERASEALYEILGLLNLAKDGGKYWRISSRIGGKLPVADVLIGPQTTTHDLNGSLTHDGFWHENWVGGPSKKILSKEHLASWEKRYQQLSKGVIKSPWSKFCRSAAVRYFKAFSNPNLEESFLDGWRLFENISGPRHEKIETKVTRASHIFKENVEYRIVGKHLALRRHLISHGHSINANDEETLAFQMLQFVLPFLTRFILNGFSFARPEDFWEFLDLPAARSERLNEVEKLQRRLKLYNKAAQFRGETDVS